jgi:hypothetical protein
VSSAFSPRRASFSFPVNHLPRKLLHRTYVSLPQWWSPVTSTSTTHLHICTSLAAAPRCQLWNRVDPHNNHVDLRRLLHAMCRSAAMQSLGLEPRRQRLFPQGQPRHKGVGETMVRGDAAVDGAAVDGLDGGLSALGDPKRPAFRTSAPRGRDDIRRFELDARGRSSRYAGKNRRIRAAALTDTLAKQIHRVVFDCGRLPRYLTAPSVNRQTDQPSV